MPSRKLPAKKPAAAHTAARKKAGPGKAAPKQAAAKPGQVLVENVNVPGYVHGVDAVRYEAMKKALLKVLPRTGPGLAQAEMFAAVVPHLPPDLFPGGAKAGWWGKTVQLDLEAKGAVLRSRTRPLRWTRR